MCTRTNLDHDAVLKDRTRGQCQFGGNELSDKSAQVDAIGSPLLCIGAMEGWPSGLRRTLGKRVYVKAYRGFESHSLRSGPIRWTGGPWVHVEKTAAPRTWAA